jgi:hypothetical protein
VPTQTFEQLWTLLELARRYAQQHDADTAELRTAFFARESPRVCAALGLPVPLDDEDCCRQGVQIEHLVHSIGLFDVKPPAVLVPRLLRNADAHLMSTARRQLPPPALAAWLHNTVMFVMPRVHRNARAARMLANSVLLAYGLAPLMPVPGYDQALHADMFSSVGVSSPGDICYTYMLGALLRMQHSHWCLYCGKANSTARCQRCKWARYCCREHQRADWAECHGPLCRANAADAFERNWLRRGAAALEGARAHLHEMAKARGIEISAEAPTHHKQQQQE